MICKQREWKMTARGARTGRKREAEIVGAPTFLI